MNNKERIAHAIADFVNAMPDRYTGEEIAATLATIGDGLITGPYPDEKVAELFTLALNMLIFIRHRTEAELREMH